MITASDVQRRIRGKYAEVALGELELVRDGVLGTEAMIEVTAMVGSAAFRFGRPDHMELIALPKTRAVRTVGLVLLSHYLFELTMGSIALIHAGYLPDVRLNAGHNNILDVLSRSEPECDGFYKHVAQKRKRPESMFSGTPNWAPHEIRATLNRLNKRFIKMLRQDAELFIDVNTQFLSSFSNEAILAALKSAPPMPSSPPTGDALQEHKRLRGQCVIEHLARQLRNEGNELYKRGQTLKGDAQAKAYQAAEDKYMAALCGSEEDAVTNANLAALNLAMKAYENAIEAAKESYTFYFYAPQSLKGQRARVIFSLRKDSLPRIEEGDKERHAMLQPIKRDEIMWKAHLRAGRAHAALFEAGIKGEDVKKGASGLGPWRHFQKAHHEICEAQSFPKEDQTQPKKDLEKLMRVYLWAEAVDDGSNDKAEVWADMDRIKREVDARKKT